MTANSLSDQLVQDRFQGRLKLLITMPMSKAAYAIGVFAFASIQSAVIMALLLTFGFVAGVDFDLTLAFIVVIVPMLLTMAGFPIFLASLAPSAEVGGIINGAVGILPVMISPVFFTMEHAPLVLRWLGWVSPFRYAADGINEISLGADRYLGRVHCPDRLCCGADGGGILEATLAGAVRRLPTYPPSVVCRL